ncbi:hypothetical protein Clacol_003046 [Clathrus columnatus]|uniref:V-type proton ATPase subunit C n=1 Tax=Clathrus columnatus TaxID=1419009 RepID=A0AAV5A5A5_9AGAM|nr:hypothetical protein Clacol_003046 [Clathrus columnatus]
MPSDQATWIISAPQDGDSEGLVQELQYKFQQQLRSFDKNNITQFVIPAFKVGTLGDLVNLSEELPKQDTYFTQTTARIVETIRSLLNNDPNKVPQHTQVNDRSIDEYLQSWKWNEGRYIVHRSLKEILDGLNGEMSSIDNVMKSKLNNYNLAKGTLTQIQRKKTYVVFLGFDLSGAMLMKNYPPSGPGYDSGTLAVRSLADIVPREACIEGSEYLETLFVAIPKNSVKDWKSKYERLTNMVVPRSSTQITTDDDYTLFSVVIFKRVHDEFAQKCRENKFVLRDFTFSEEDLIRQREEQRTTEISERELWTELLRLARTNFSEAYQILVHLKVVRLFVESVLRYGLPAQYLGVLIKPDPKQTKKILGLLMSHLSYLKSRSQSSKITKSTGKESKDEEELGGEWQALMEEEMFDFVLFEIPWITTEV